MRTRTISRPRRAGRTRLARIVVASGLVAGIGAAGALTPARAATPLLGRYIIQLDDGVADPAAVAREQLGLVGGSLGLVYANAIKGYAATLPQALVAQLLGDPRVKLVAPDTLVHLDATQVNPPSYGLDRIDQRTLPLSGSYTYGPAGAGVTVYDIDTGLNFASTDFTGRAVTGVDLIDGGQADDCNGHGTHTAGTAVGTTYGVAKQANLSVVRVFDCSGSTATSTIIAGVDFVTANHTTGPAVVNMSLGGSANTALDNAVRGMIADGVTAAIAAGNGNALGRPANSCSQSPARVTEALTVGASDSSDKAASFSNYGTCVDLFGPGVNITSDWIGGPTATNTISGTSMATPHVAGAAALYLSGHPTATPAQTGDAVKALTTKGKVAVPAGGLFGGGTPNNHLLYTTGL